MRTILPVLAGAAVAALGALIAGEYEFAGVVPFVVGLLLGLVVSEVVALGGQWRGWVPAALAAALAAGAVIWGGWIDSGQGIEPYPVLAWAGAAVAAAVALVRVRPAARVRPRPRQPTND
ncbi:MAG: hypothetical protein KY441_00315 [Actinobacteria bacterium]|nr:hypothetical protein [Actinomycetota bacterium]MBW3643931.1 hypothetical protein [Actinomycetota bacterium]